MAEEHERPWQPLSPPEVAAVFGRAAFPWWIAGGHAIAFAVGHRLRAHADIDILLLRKDQAVVRALLDGWDCWAADPPGTLRPWKKGEVLPPHVSDIWCRQEREGPWQFQLMLDDGNHHQWHSRRNPLVTKPIATLRQQGDDGGLPFLIPEVPLFYKAKAPRPKDEIDFAAVRPLLSRSQRTWLGQAIASTYGDRNVWLETLGAGW